jgi:hypothetical protein
MPVLSKFYGIVIRMLFSRIFPARFHAIYQQCEVVVQIEPLRIVSGEAPPRVCEMVLEWAAEHQQELLQAWKRCASAQKPAPILPLL